MTESYDTQTKRITALHEYEQVANAHAAGEASDEDRDRARRAALNAGADYNALVCAADGFIPEKVRIDDYPHPVGAIVSGTGGLLTVVDRDGWAFLACCTQHHTEGRANGFFPQMSHGRHLAQVEPSDVDSYDCPFPNGFFG
ncbi:hypothetical protein [Streptomyces sp. SID10815]|uniref:hypothetical protein n=1 Tax=Streptomyces sp. SID10815 TaxID=2706027 RepID=UPI0013C70486|nr:hypothetical protein [Streptomyces sp. SID10815]NEA52353.1 hypothetical protein [Streptomyces sp. SID10815]